MEHMPHSTVWDAVALLTGASLVSLLQPQDWVWGSSPGRHYFQHITTMDLH